MKVEVSNPHLHPSHETAKGLKLTKKRDLSVPPHWVANERVEKDGKSYAVVMPPRIGELYEERQIPHIHMPEYVYIDINGVSYAAKVKLSNEHFDPVVHFDNIDAKQFGIKGGEEATI